MKYLFNNYFEKTWTLIFLFMFFLIMIPFPFFYSETYIPSLNGIPLFLFGWFVHTGITFILIVIFYYMCMRRKEYHIYDKEENK